MDDQNELEEFAQKAASDSFYELSTDYRPDGKKMDAESDVSQRGIDQFTAPEASPQESTSDSTTNLSEREIVVQKEDNEPEVWVGLFRDA